jgi:hypothetical protein
LGTKNDSGAPDALEAPKDWWAVKDSNLGPAD